MAKKPATVETPQFSEQHLLGMFDDIKERVEATLLEFAEFKTVVKNALGEIKVRLDNLETSPEEDQEVIDMLPFQNGLTELQDEFAALSKTFKKDRLTEVSEIDGNLHFQHCLNIGIEAVLKNRDLLQLMNNQAHIDQAVNAAIDFARQLHESICNRFKIEL